MKPLLSFVGLCFALALLNHPNASAANSNLVVGTWETQWIGPNRDRATCYLTFSNDFTWTGYGIALKSLGPVDITGTWGVDSKGRINGSFTQFRADGDMSGTLLTLKVAQNHLRGRAVASLGQIIVKGDTLDTPPDVSGSNWIGEVRTRGNTSFQSYTVTANTNAPGWFDITGSGIGQSGTFTISGAIIVTTERAANGYLVSDFGTGNTTSTWSFAGKFLPSLDRATFRGRTDNGNDLLIRLSTQ